MSGSNSEYASKAMGQKLLQGYTMLADSCPNPSCGLPLMRAKNSQKGICVVCGDYSEQPSSSTPATKAPVVTNSDYVLIPSVFETTPKAATKANKTAAKKTEKPSAQASAAWVKSSGVIISEAPPLVPAPIMDNLYTNSNSSPVRSLEPSGKSATPTHDPVMSKALVDLKTAFQRVTSEVLKLSSLPLCAAQNSGTKVKASELNQLKSAVLAADSIACLIERVGRIESMNKTK